MVTCSYTIHARKWSCLAISVVYHLGIIGPRSKVLFHATHCTSAECYMYVGLMLLIWHCVHVFIQLQLTACLHCTIIMVKTYELMQIYTKILSTTLLHLLSYGCVCPICLHSLQMAEIATWTITLLERIKTLFYDIINGTDIIPTR